VKAGTRLGVQSISTITLYAHVHRASVTFSTFKEHELYDEAASSPANPSAGPSANPSASPSASPSANPSASPSANFRTVQLSTQHGTATRLTMVKRLYDFLYARIELYTDPAVTADGIAFGKNIDCCTYFTTRTRKRVVLGPKTVITRPIHQIRYRTPSSPCSRTTVYSARDTVSSRRPRMRLATLLVHAQG